MTREEQMDWILREKLIAVVRSPESSRLVQVVEALRDGGVRIAEITLTVPNALEVLRATRAALGDSVLLGAGSVLDGETARAAILAGAEFIVGPNCSLDVIRVCRRYGKVVCPGAFTPTEIVTAWEAGADIVKVFPAEIGGPDYFKAVRGPLPQIRLMPTGGVHLESAPRFLAAGASCLGVGSSLVDPKLIASGDFESLRARAAQFVAAVAGSRS